MALLSLNNVSLGYEGKEILHGVSFCVNQGDYLCIIGENGSGKTTLLKSLVGLVKPLSGEICLYGAHACGYLPQRTEVQHDFPASVLEVVLSGTLHHRGYRPFYSQKERTTARQNMQRLEIESLAKKSFHSLSGGQQQKVLLARALCATSTLLLLDEPTEGLDPLATAHLYGTFEALNRDGVTIIMVTHDIPAAIKYASHILHLQNKPLFFGTKQQYLHHPLAHQFFQEGGAFHGN